MLEAISRWNRWGGARLTGGICRDVLAELQSVIESKDIVVLMGPRRAGKTTVLFQIMDLLEQQGVPQKAMLHLNLEEPAFALELGIELLEKIYNNFREHVCPEGKAYLFLDEIQNIHQWERWIRARNETENIKIFITGSSSRLMSRELGTLLTGRHLSFKVFPLSFKEFLRFENIEVPKSILPLREKPKYYNMLNKYLKWGGFPEVVLAEDDYRKELLLRQYFDDILFKDVAVRHEIRDVNTLRNMAVHLLTQTGNLISAQRLSKLFGVSLDLAKSYCGYLQEAFLIHFGSYYSQKVSERNRNPQKVHALDLGMRQIVSLAHSPDKGHLIETAVQHVLMRQPHDGIFYWQEDVQIDFAVRKANSIKTLVQVFNGDFRDLEFIPREIKALTIAGKNFPNAEKIIIASNAIKKSYLKAQKDIQIIPLLDFLLAS